MTGSGVDVEAVRGLARQTAELAGRVRGVAARTSAARSVQWSSTAAERWREELRAEAGLVAATAEELDDAVRALHRHADEVQQRLAQIAAVQAAFTAAVDRAAAQVADAATTAAGATGREGASRLLDLARSAPAPGSLDWLDPVWDSARRASS